MKTNKLVWDAVSPSARTNDLKLQKLETSVIKADTVLSKVANSMAAIEKEHVKFGEMIDNCNMSLALLGHSNKQINIRGHHLEGMSGRNVVAGRTGRCVRRLQPGG